MGDGLEMVDALVALLQVLARSPQLDLVISTLLPPFFLHTMGKANLPDAYDETLETTSTETCGCSDILRLMATIAKDRPEVVETTRTWIRDGSTSTESGSDT